MSSQNRIPTRIQHIYTNTASTPTTTSRGPSLPQRCTYYTSTSPSPQFSNQNPPPPTSSSSLTSRPNSNPIAYPNSFPPKSSPLSSAFQKPAQDPGPTADLPSKPTLNPPEPKSKSSDKPTPPPPPPILKDSKTQKTYYLGNLLGTGGFAHCYEVVDDQGLHYAVKVVYKKSLKNVKARKKLLSEIKIHQSLKHKYLVQFLHCFEDSDNVYMILELCENRTMMDFLRKRKRLSEPEVRFYMIQILEAIRFMHGKNIIHRDLKLGNMFLTKDMNIKIGDFGLAAKLLSDGERKKTICGTPNYIAPEILFDTENGHSFEVDVWSLGVIMYTMLIGKPPFQTKEVKAIYRRIKDNNYEFPENIPLSPESRALISSLLSSQPENRPTLSSMCEHAFFRSDIPLSIPQSALTTVPTFNSSNLFSLLSKGHTENTKPDVSKKKELSNDLEKAFSAFSVSSKRHAKTAPTSPTQRTRNTDKEVQISPYSSNGKATQVQKKGLSFEVQIPSRATSLGGQQISDTFKKGTLEATLKNLVKLLRQNSSGQPMTDEGHEVKKPDVFISKWIDYSNRYGLGYHLTNGSVGVHFNDATSIILAADEEHFEYVDTINKDGKLQSRRQGFTIREYPETLHKKVMLLRHFRDYMSEHLSKGTMYNYSDVNRKKNLDFLAKYMRTNKAVIFRLSNRVIQFNFVDHVKLLLTEDGKSVTVIDSQKKMTHLSLCSILQSGNTDLIERIEYAKEMLEKMWFKKKQSE